MMNDTDDPNKKPETRPMGAPPENGEEIKNGDSMANDVTDGARHDDIYRTEVEFLKAFAHNTDSTGLYALNLNLMPSNFSGAGATRFIYAAFLRLYSENRPLTYKMAYELLAEQRHRDRTQADVAGDLLEAIFNLTGIAGERPVEPDVKALIYRIKENGFKNEARKVLSASLNRLNHDRGDYVNTVKKSAETLLSMLEANSLHSAANSEVDVKAFGIELELMAQKKARPFPGFDTGFDTLNLALNGIENELYLIGGGSSMGKTTFATQLAFQLLKQNPELNLLFFSLDQSQKDILVKFVSAASGVPVKYVKCPSPKNEAHEAKKKDGIAAVTQMAKRMKIIDESHGEVSIRDFKNIVRKYKIEYHNKPIVVIADTVMDIKPVAVYNDREAEINSILSEIKTLIRTENIAVIGTFNLGTGAETARPTRKHISEIPPLIYQPYATLTIFSDFVLNFETPFLEWEWGTDDAMIPIVEVDVIKNKMNGFRGKIFYRYFDSLAALRECVEEDNANYRAMIENIEHYQTKRGNQPLIAPVPPPPPMPNIRTPNGQQPYKQNNPDQSSSAEDII